MRVQVLLTLGDLGVLAVGHVHTGGEGLETEKEYGLRGVKDELLQHRVQAEWCLLLVCLPCLRGATVRDRRHHSPWSRDPLAQAHMHPYRIVSPLLVLDEGTC